AEAVAAQTRSEMAQRLSSALLSLASGGGGGQLATALEGQAAPAPGATSPATPDASAGNGGADWEYDPVWVESNECTTCDECLEIAPGAFVYNDDKQVVVKDPKGAPYKDLVRAAEKCPALAIHPGTPANPDEPDAEKLMKRAAKFN
ncbi:MAG: ferredoxin, partial [Ectothiorhodospira sp.]